MCKNMNIKYHGEELPFEPKESDELGIKGLLKLTTEQRDKFVRLEENEDELWYLDDQGERLESEQLFLASPWSIEGPNGETKLICRYQDRNSGEVWLNTEEGYSSELFQWLRQQANT